MPTWLYGSVGCGSERLMPLSMIVAPRLERRAHHRDRVVDRQHVADDVDVVAVGQGGDGVGIAAVDLLGREALLAEPLRRLLRLGQVVVGEDDLLEQLPCRDRAAWRWRPSTRRRRRFRRSVPSCVTSRRLTVRPVAAPRVIDNLLGADAQSPRASRQSNADQVCGQVRKPSKSPRFRKRNLTRLETGPWRTPHRGRCSASAARRACSA